MALTFITANAQTSAVLYCGSHPFFPPDHNSFTTILDDADTGVKDLLANINSHTFDNVMTDKPYIKAFYDGSYITVTLVNPPATVPEAATLSILGTAYILTIDTDYTVKLPIIVHPSVAQSRINVSIKVEGFPITYLEIGGNSGSAETQMYQDNNANLHVVPLNNIDLANYWTNTIVDTKWNTADVATITGLLAHTLFHYVIPALNLTLTEDEQNALSDIQTNIIPSIVSTLGTVKPVIGTEDLHYMSYKGHLAQAKVALNNYINDKDEILKYTSMK